MYKVVKFPALIFKVFIAAILIAGILASQNIVNNVFGEQELWGEVISGLFNLRNGCVVSGDLEKLKSVYLTSEQNGLWAYENEKNRAKAIQIWSRKQGATMLCINTEFVIKRVKKVGRGYSFYIVASNEYNYSYNDDPDTVNIFRIGTYHSLDLIPGKDGNSWIISREWYDDPFSKIPDAEFPVEISEYITSMTLPDLSGLSARRIKAANTRTDTAAPPPRRNTGIRTIKTIRTITRWAATAQISPPRFYTREAASKDNVVELQKRKRQFQLAQSRRVQGLSAVQRQGFPARFRKLLLRLQACIQAAAGRYHRLRRKRQDNACLGGDGLDSRDTRW